MKLSEILKKSGHDWVIEADFEGFHGTFIAWNRTSVQVIILDSYKDNSIVEIGTYKRKDVIQSHGYFNVSRIM